ncbi:hypothetical protein DICVIV_13602 [Dictyocaulus viviparus]|uniref:Uncharacterized protein n=1 Tax=Dictyocaulus viviparus TaxID=29172 RepID=A0A0D8X7C2_DICVI|nr:hypothetical protein DICVIV_13602 [Dictyocaulus viviparus]
MDKHLKGSKKNSILKSQKTVVDGEKATIHDDQNAHKRGVSFHSLKTVQKFEESHLSLLDGSPFEVKIEETTSSNGVPTYDKCHMPSTTPMVTDEMETSFVNSAVIISDGKVFKLISYGFRFWGVGRGTSYIGGNKTRDNNDETCDMDIALTNSVCSRSDCTINLFERMSSGGVSDLNVAAIASSLEEAENACEILCNRYNDGEWKGDDNSGENNNSISLEGGEAEIRNLSAVCTTRNLNKDSFDMNIHEIDNITELDCSVENLHNESSIIKRNISIMQGGGRFRISSFPSSETFSIQSFLHDSVRFRNKMMFNTHSLQINYVNPASNQPGSNVIREKILDELQSRMLEIKENSSSKVSAVFPKLNTLYPEALALKNIDLRRLGSDYHELVYRARFRAEIEWAQIRLQISRKYRSKLEQSIKNDEAVLKTIQKNVQLCNSLDKLQKDVEALQTELNALPNAEEIAEKIDRHKQAFQDEKDLDRQILDLEIKELRLELQLARLKNKEFRKKVACLNKFADAHEENNTRVNELVQEVLSGNQSE